MMTVLTDARRVAAHHGHHAAYAAGGDGVDERPVSGAEPPAEIVRQVLVGEAGHQIHTVARNVYPRRIAVLERLHGASENLPGGPFGVVRIELDMLRARDVRSEEHTSELQSLRHLVCRLL